MFGCVCLFVWGSFFCGGCCCIIVWFVCLFACLNPGQYENILVSFIVVLTIAEILFLSPCKMFH